MSELLDNQVDIENENLKIKILGFAQALVKVAMKIQRNKEKNDCHAKKFMRGKKTGRTDFGKLQVTDSTLNECTDSLVNELDRGGKNGSSCIVAQ